MGFPNCVLKLDVVEQPGAYVLVMLKNYLAIIAHDLFLESGPKQSDERSGFGFDPRV